MIKTTSFLLIFIGLLASSCQKTSLPNTAEVGYVDSVIWAVNVGGSDYLGSDGVSYQADNGFISGDIQSMSSVKGSQDSVIYFSYREGDININYPLENGRYDVMFLFAEPEDIPGGSRIFDVIVEEDTVIPNLDVRAARDGKHISALTRTIPNVNVTDGELSASLIPIKGKPVLSALIVRKKLIDERNWELIWSDEFNYEGAPDSSKWNIELWPARRVNDEDQTYTGRPKNVRVENGNLVLEAHKEQFNNAEYTSGRIQSQGKGDFTYGRVEVRAKLPGGQGSWPAIWMLGSQSLYGENYWPDNGEIDIMEHVGYDMNNVHGTVHNRAYYWMNWEQRKGAIQTKNIDSEFHVYAMEWTPERIDIFYNGTKYFTYVNEGDGWESWPFDQPHHMILNVAVGGFWGRAGGPIDDSIFPIRMEVDYVRIFKNTSDS